MEHNDIYNSSEVIDLGDGFKARITEVFGDDIENPRDFALGSTIYSLHRNYNPDGHRLDELGVFSGADLPKLSKNYIWLPIFYYEHGGIALSTEKFYNPFDSGFFGVIAVKKSCVRELHHTKKITFDIRKAMEHTLQNEVFCLSQYYNGQGWKWEVCYEKENDAILDSGFAYFHNLAKECAITFGKIAKKEFLSVEQ